MTDKLKPCPFCGGNNISMSAFSIAPECYIECQDCGASISSSVSWGKFMSEKKHDKLCAKKLTKKWNRRADNDK